MMLKVKIGFVFAMVSLLVACKVDPKINPVLPSDDLKEIVPEGWPNAVYSFSNNPVNENVFILGRALFYDPILSKDNTISCGSCHQQFVAFAHAEHNLSHGINGLLGNRNTPALFNLTWHKTFMHDGGINHLEVQPLAPIENPVEMDLPINEALLKLSASAKYRTLFKNAYGTEEVTDPKMLKAMAQFMGLMYSYNSKYDLYKRQENNVQFNDAELRGYALFIAKCNACHTEPLFSDFSFRSNGLAVNLAINDSGRAHITNAPEDKYKFKVPSLRNVALTAPYMHDGRYATLEQCLNHYTDNVSNMVNLDPLLKPNGIALTSEEKQDLISFLRTLTDYKFINDKRFADPN